VKSRQVRVNDLVLHTIRTNQKVGTMRQALFEPLKAWAAGEGAFPSGQFDTSPAACLKPECNVWSADLGLTLAKGAPPPDAHSPHAD
jgi:hypothetical protein